jgi:hypothetical protein
MQESQIERRPYDTAARGSNPLATPAVASAVALLKAGAACRFCAKTATRLIGRGQALVCDEHGAQTRAARLATRGF